MNDSTTTDVLICGAGAAGLTLAVELARRSVRFRLIEKLAEPFGGSRGKGLQPRTLEIFEDLDIVDRVVAAGGAYPLQREYRADGSYEDVPLFEPSAPKPDEPYQTPLMLPQFLTEAALRERLTELGHRPEFGSEMTGLWQDHEGVTATIVSSAGEETIRSRYLVGTDGGRSFVRHALKVEFPGKTLGVRAVVADVMATGLSRDAWHRFNAGSMEQQISLCPLPGTEMFQLQGPIPLEGDVDLSAKGLSALVAQRTGRSEININSVSWASAFNMNARLAERYRDGHIFLAGDAAHTHPPTGGQGLNTSVQDAYNLGWKLAAVLRGHRKPFWIATNRNAGQLPNICWDSQRSCWTRLRLVRGAVAGRCSSSISATRIRFSPWRGRGAKAASSRATVRQTHQYEEQEASRPVCLICSKELTGR